MRAEAASLSKEFRGNRKLLRLGKLKVNSHNKSRSEVVIPEGLQENTMMLLGDLKKAGIRLPD